MTSNAEQARRLVELGLASHDQARTLYHQASTSGRDLADLLLHSGRISALEASHLRGASAQTATPARERIGPYELLGELGRGGMGVVLEARHTQLDRKVALKLLREGADASLEDLRRFEVEARAMARLQHPHILRVLDVGSSERGVYMATELAEGGSLADRLAAEGALDEAAALELAQQLAEGLAHAHGQALIHRDLKPANVLLDAEGRPLIADFGLAKTMDEEGGLSKTGMVLGTLAYMPPEQIEGQIGRIDGRADIYALGATLYEMLTGAPPFSTKQSQQRLIAAILFREPEAAAARGAEVEAATETILARCLAKEPERRYQTARELADDLRRALAKEPIRARPVSLGERLNLWWRRHPRLIGSAAALTLIAATAAAFASRWTIAELSRRADAAQAAREQAERSEREARDALALAKRAREAAVEASDRAREAAAEAQLRFSEQRELAGKTLFELHDALVAIPGTTRVREDIILQAERALASLEASAADDPGLRLAVATTNIRLGDVLIGDLFSNRSQHHAGFARYDRATAILESLLDETADAEVKLHLGRALTRRVTAGMLVERGPEPMARFERGMTCLREAYAADPQGYLPQFALAEAKLLLAERLNQARQREGLFQATGAALSSARALRELAPDDAAGQRFELRALINHVTALRLEGEGGSAAPLLDAAEGRLERLLRLAPRDPRLRYLKAVARIERALVQPRHPAWPSPLADREAAVEELEELHREDVSNSQVTKLLTVNLNALGQELFDRGDISRARSSYEASLAAWETLEVPKRELPTQVVGTMVPRTGIARCAREQGDWPTAKATSRALAEDLYKVLRDHPELRNSPVQSLCERSLSLALVELGVAELALGERQAAATHLNLGARACAETLRAQPGDREVEGALEDAKARLAGLEEGS